MSRRYPTVVLREMLDSSREAAVFTQGRSRADLQADLMFEYAVLHLVHVVGGVARRMPRQLRPSYPTIPWNDIIDVGEHVLRDYDAINYDRVWDALQHNIPDFVALLEAFLRDEGV